MYTFSILLPGVPPNSFKSAYDAGGDEVALIWCGIRKQVKANGEVKVARIEIYQMVSAIRRNVVQKFLCQITMEIDRIATP